MPKRPPLPPLYADIDWSKVNWTKVSFPSDRLPLGELRKRAGGHPEDAGILAHNLILSELELARDALVLTVTPRNAEDTEQQRIRKIMIEFKGKELADLYVTMGVAGKHEATQLTQQLIEAAQALAPEKSKRGRG